MTDLEPSAGWREQIPPGEVEQFAVIAAKINQYQRVYARRGDGQVHRAFHVKSHTALRAQFRVLDDIPDKARHGVFKAPRVFPAWVRLSNGYSAPMPDWFPDLMGCAVKLMGVEGEKLLPGESNADSQDFLCLNQPSVPADDAQQLLIISTAPANPLTAPFKLLSALGLAHTLRVVTWGLGWALPRIVLRSAVTFDFYSITPISLGPHAVKFRWASRQDKRPLPTPGASWLNYLREELRARLAQGELRYDFQVQFYVDPIKTPIDGAALWSEADAPFVTLAELVVPPCDLDSEQSKADQRRLDGLGFNPWRALPEHRPLGNIQRARGMIYQGSQTYSGRDPDPTA